MPIHSRTKVAHVILADHGWMCHTPPKHPVDAAYEAMGKRTFLAMGVMVGCYLLVLVGFIGSHFLYNVLYNSYTGYSYISYKNCCLCILCSIHKVS